MTAGVPCPLFLVVEEECITLKALVLFHSTADIMVTHSGAR
jgi:hypothetical protein